MEELNDIVKELRAACADFTKRTTQPLADRLAPILRNAEATIGIADRYEVCEVTGEMAEELITLVIEERSVSVATEVAMRHIQGIEVIVSTNDGWALSKGGKVTKKTASKKEEKKPLIPKVDWKKDRAKAADDDEDEEDEEEEEEDLSDHKEEVAGNGKPKVGRAAAEEIEEDEEDEEEDIEDPADIPSDAIEQLQSGSLSKETIAMIKETAQSVGLKSDVALAVSACCAQAIGDFGDLKQVDLMRMRKLDHISKESDVIHELAKRRIAAMAKEGHALIDMDMAEEMINGELSDSVFNMLSILTQKYSPVNTD